MKSRIREQKKYGRPSQLCNKSTLSRILIKQASLGPESKLLEMSDREQIVSYTRALQWCNLFSPGQKISRRLHWDCILFFVECNQSEKPVQRKPQKNRKGEQVWRSRSTRKRGSKPLKKLRGAANLQSSQKISISRACETKLGCVLSFLENATTTV